MLSLPVIVQVAILIAIIVCVYALEGGHSKRKKDVDFNKF